MLFARAHLLGTGHVASECNGEGDDAEDGIAIQKLGYTFLAFEVAPADCRQRFLSLHL